MLYSLSALCCKTPPNRQGSCRMTAPHQFNPTILREYDIRGIVGDSLNAADARALGHAFGSAVRRRGGRSVALGFDGRASSPDLAAAVTEGLTSTGLDVRRIGIGPTPMLYFAVHHLETDGGIMVTGSHNPPDYNGFKMVWAGGVPVYGSEIQELGRLAAAGDIVDGAGAASDVDIFEAYIDRLLRDFDGHPLNVAWDPGNGAAGRTTEALAARLPGRHIVINGEIDGSFPNHHPDPTVEENLQQLKDVVLREGLDLGIGFDGDGDRIGAVDGKGRVVWGDQLLLILARHLLKDLPGSTVIADVKASQVLFDGIAAAGGEPVMWKTGHSLLKVKMAELGAPLAGEMSGHIFFKHKFYGYDDALYDGLRLMNAISAEGGDLAAIMDDMPRLHNTPEIRFDCPEERKWQVVDEVRDRLQGGDAEVIDVDGVRVIGEDGWWLLRASNTQAVLVGRAESATADGLERLKSQLREQLELSGVTAPEGL